ncbi:unnamed protein product, partial [Hydatigera taeniaeformis]|uniref:Transcriptional regulator n=1 Tax=Hydatigena taeniaeformis TaxID=6205 RepID=A0A0R3X653_HYDTA
MVEDRGGNFILDDLVPDEYVVSPCHDHLHEIKVIAEGYKGELLRADDLCRAICTTLH